MSLWGLLTLGLSLKLIHVLGSMGLSLRFLHRSVRAGTHGACPDIILIVPLLREQKLLPGLLSRFAALIERTPGFRLALVTTEREIVDAGTRDNTTISLLESLLKEFQFSSVRHLHYPAYNTVLAEQLNFAAQILAKEAGATQENRYILIYNADSIIDEQTLSDASDLACARLPVAQQSSLFLSNVPRLIERGDYFLAAHGLYQSRWTLHYELPRYLVSPRRLPWLPQSMELLNLVHCVGHGLLIRLDVLEQCGWFPNPTIGTEDVALGYVLKRSGYHVEAFPHLENAETPDSVRQWWNQLSGWFWAPLGYIGYESVVPSSARERHLLQRSILRFQGIGLTLNWLLAGPLLLLYPLTASSKQELFIALALLTAYVYLPLAGLLRLWRRLPEQVFPRAPQIPLLLIALVYYPLAMVAHSAPAFNGLRWAFLRMMGRNINRPKTER